MPKLKIEVTSNVLAHVAAEGDRGKKQRQITVTEISQDLPRARPGQTVDIELGGVWALKLGDTNSVWFPHQPEGKHRATFEHLYSLLSLYPDQSVTLEW
jgi:hypothetical protein